MYEIKVKVSPTVTPEQQKDPRFLKLFEESEIFFNSHIFREKYRALLCLHEAGHILYARRLGSEPVFHGPEMFWDSRPEFDMPAISRCTAEFTVPRDAAALDVLKANLAGVVFRQVLSDTPNDEIAINIDIATARAWYANTVGGTEEEFQQAAVKARLEILTDLGSVEFQKLVWETAKEFGREVFPLPKLTAKMLRDRRLGSARF